MKSIKKQLAEIDAHIKKWEDMEDFSPASGIDYTRTKLHWIQFWRGKRELVAAQIGKK